MRGPQTEPSSPTSENQVFLPEELLQLYIGIISSMVIVTGTLSAYILIAYTPA